MSSSPEFSSNIPSSPYATEVEARSIKIADWHGAERVKKLRAELEFLARQHPNLLNAEEIEAAVENEQSWASHAAFIERELGQMNDRTSQAPGIFITGKLDWRGFDTVREYLDGYAAPYNLDIQGSNMLSSELPYSLHLSKGVFEYIEHLELQDEPHSQEYLYIYATVNPDSNGSLPRDRFGHFDQISVYGPVSLLRGGYVKWGGSSDHILGWIGRIEGSRGELWQNPWTDPDGSRKPKEELPRKRKVA